MWMLRPEERLREWMTFRNQLDDLPLEEACERTSHLWSYAPFVTHYLDSNKDTSLVSWPDPWVLLYDNYYCGIAKSLGMLYTLYLSKHRPEDITLDICKDKQTKEMHNLVILGRGKYILNFEFDTVVNKKQIPALDVIHSYTAKDLNIDLY